jgi:hypothetical protein
MKLLVPTTVLLLLLSWQPSASAQTPAVSHAVVTATQVNGTWRTKGGEFRIWAMGKQRLRVEFSGIYVYQTSGGPIANLGEARGIATITGATADFKPEGTNGQCTITMTFKRGRLSVNEIGECNFGRHVTSRGDYRKVSSRKPRFGAQR